MSLSKSSSSPSLDPTSYPPGLAPGALFLSADRAELLVAGGTPEELGRAEEILGLILECQEQRPDAAHRGNFLWKHGDAVVGDLNAVEFILKHFIPMMIRHADRLSVAMRDRILESIRLGLDEIRAKDVAITYTNVAAMDCMNSCLGGELIRDTAIAQRGYDKLKRLTDLTAANGTIFEFNSPSYVLVTLAALHRLASLVQHEETRVRARAMAARLGLSMALHIHKTTGRNSGPHSRAYLANVVCTAPPEVTVVRKLMDDGVIPRWIERVLEAPAPTGQIVETAMREWRVGSIAYHTPSFAMGTASREISWQTDSFIVHYRMPGEERPGVVYSRYLINDAWFTEDPKARDRSNVRNLTEHGKFYGVQDGPRAIGIYAPQTLERFGSFAPCSRDIFDSARAAIIWSRADKVDEVWAGERRVMSFPAEVVSGETVVVASGEVYVAIRPLSRTDLGYGAPIRLVEVEGELLLEIYNYLGPKKCHNALERRSRFYQGQPQCGFYAEVAERSAYSDSAAFGRVVASGALRDEAAPPFTAYMERTDRPWNVEYTRDGKTLGIEVNLMEWELKRRWTEKGELGWPMLESPHARQNADGRVAVGDAVLTCGKAPAWLFADPRGGFCAAGYHGDPALLTLEIAGHKVEVPSMGIGTVVWENGKVTIEQ